MSIGRASDVGLGLYIKVDGNLISGLDLGLGLGIWTVIGPDADGEVFIFSGCSLDICPIYLRFLI